MSGIINSAGSRSGVIGATAPAFFAQLIQNDSTANQTLTTATYTELVCENDSTAGWTFDSHNWYDTSNGRFTPKYDGYYSFSANVGWTNDLNAEVVRKVMLSKNWSGGVSGVFRSATDFQVLTNGGNTQQIHGMTYCNGSSDFISVIVYHAHGDYRDIDGDSIPHHEACNFSGFMIR